MNVKHLFMKHIAVRRPGIQRDHLDPIEAGRLDLFLLRSQYLYSVISVQPQDEPGWNTFSLNGSLRVVKANPPKIAR